MHLLPITLYILNASAQTTTREVSWLVAVSQEWETVKLLARFWVLWFSVWVCSTTHRLIIAVLPINRKLLTLTKCHSAPHFNVYRAAIQVSILKLGDKAPLTANVDQINTINKEDSFPLTAFLGCFPDLWLLSKRILISLKTFYRFWWLWEGVLCVLGHYFSITRKINHLPIILYDLFEVWPFPV